MAKPQMKPDNQLETLARTIAKVTENRPPTVMRSASGRSACAGALVALVLFAAGNSVAEPDWRSYFSPEAGFRVDVPDDVAHDVSSTWSILGNVQMDRYAIRLPSARLDLERHEIPRLAPFLLSADFVLDLARNNLLEDIGAELISEASTTRRGYVGRRLVMRRKGLASDEETQLQC